MSHRRFPVLILAACLVAALFALVGCGGGSDDEAQVLATVGDRSIDVEYYKSRLAKLEENQLPVAPDGTPYDMSTLEGKRAFLDIIIDKELMVAKALDMGYDQDSQVDAALEALTEFQAMKFFWADEIGDPSRFVSDEDVDRYYSRLGERRQCHFIITDLESDAVACREEFAQGVPWSELVAKYHDGPLRGDKLPNLAVSWGQYRDDFEQPIFEVAEGELTEPIPTEHGWWLLRVDEVVQEDKPALESIKDKVLLSISKRKENLRREELIARVLEERDFQLNEEALGIIYEGLPAEENIVDPVTSKPVPREDLEPLDVPSESYDTVVMSYELSTGPVEMTIADIKAQFDKQNVFERPKKAELIGGLRTKLSNAAEKTIMVDESRERGYFEDERVLAAAYRQVEEMLVDKVHSEILSYEQYVSPDELEAFWAEHADQYERPERRTGQMVRCANRATAEQARAAIVSGESTWKSVVRQFGNDPELEQTFGRFPLVRADETTPLRDVLFALDKDEISEPFAMDGGSWGVVQVTRILPAEDPTLEEMTEAVSARIRNQRMDVALRELLDEWKKEYPVSVDEDLLATMPSWPEAVQEASESQFQVSRKD